jgi:putative ABC transport system substrate-binding protein
MTRKFLGLLVTTFLLVTASFAEAQQPTKMARIGVLPAGSPASMATRVEAFRQALRELGYVEGRNIVLEYRYADGKYERYRDLADDLVRLKPDIIVVSSTGFTTAAKEATKTIPIVVAGAGDLVGTGVVASLARPGGNVTGSTSMASDLSGKRLELLKEVVPKASRVAVFWRKVPGSQDDDEVKETQVVASPLGITVQLVPVRGTDEFQGAFAAMKKGNAGALIIIQGGYTNVYRRQLAELAIKNRLPTMCEQPTWTEDGCLMSYGSDPNHNWRRAATFVDKILKGRKPADLPVEQPTKFELVFNLNTAKQIGLTIPPNVLARADKVLK